MTKPDTPFPKHWLYYIILKYGVIAVAVLITLYTVYRLIYAHVPEKWTPVFRRGHAPTQEVRTSATMSKQAFPTRTHKIAIAVVALVTAVALMSNYYLW